MLDEVVRAYEAVTTHGAPELFVAGMGATVSRQLIRAGEPALAPGHGARIRPLSCVISVVGFEVGRLEVSFPALGVVAHERPLSFVLAWKMPLPPLRDAGASDLGGSLGSPHLHRRRRNRLRRGLQDDDGWHDDRGMGIGASRDWRMRPKCLLFIGRIIA